MKRRVLALLLLVAPAEAQTVGATCLNCLSPKFQGLTCHRFKQMYRGVRHLHTAVLWDPKVFGGDKRCLRQWAKLPARARTLEVHETCGPCERNGAFPGYQARPGRYVPAIIDFCERHGLRCLYSSVLEYREIPDETRSWPFEIVSNPIPILARVPSDFIELHGAEELRPRAGKIGLIGDLDGDELSWPAVLRWIQARTHYDFLRVWKCGWQGVCNGNSQPSQRRFVIPFGDVFEVRKILRRYDHVKETSCIPPRKARRKDHDGRPGRATIRAWASCRAGARGASGEHRPGVD